jgi:chitinase
MGYDFTGPWTEVAGHHARLLPPPVSSFEHSMPVLRRSCHHGVDFLIQQGVPRAKIVLGVAAYARFFPGCRGPGQPNAKDACGEMDYCELPRDWVTRAAVDQHAGAAWFVDDGPNGKGFVSFDAPGTVVEKARYAKAMGLRGLFYWTGSGDIEDDESLSLVATGWRGLREL